MRNMKGLNWSMEHFVDMIPDIALVIIGEFIIDWLKHAFITKFNEIPAAVYRGLSSCLFIILKCLRFYNNNCIRCGEKSR